MLRGHVASLLFALLAVAPAPAAADGETWGFDWLGRIESDAQGLDSEDPEIRLAAVNALRGYDPALTRRFLLKALGDDEDAVRLAAARALAAGGVAETVPRVIEWLGEADSRVRGTAAEVLGQLGTEAGSAALIRTLGDTDPVVRVKAVTALGAIGGRGDRSVVVPLISRLSDDKTEVRRGAIEQLRAIGDRRAVVPLVGAFTDNSLEVRKAAVQAVGRLGDRAAIPALMRLLGDPVPEIRGLAIGSLGELGAVEAVDELIQILSSSGDHVAKAAFALGQIARLGDPEASPLAVEALVAALADAAQRDGATEALRAAGTIAVPALVAHLDGQLAGDPTRAVRLLAELGDARATDALVAELERGRVAVADVVAALARTRDPRALIPVLRLIAADDATIRLAAMTAIGPLLGTDPRAADAIVERLGDEDEEIRVLAAEYLGQIGARNAVAPLVGLAGGGNPLRLRRAAIDALGGIGDARAVPALLAAIKDGPEPLQQAAADALSYIGDPGSATLLGKLADDLRGPGRHHAVRAWGAVLRDRPEPRTRARLEELARTAPAPVAIAAIGALAAMGDAAAAPTLIALVGAATPERQRAAAWALGELGVAAAVPVLVAALASSDDRVASAAAWALGDLAAKPALRAQLAQVAGPALRRLARRGSWATAIDATATLGRARIADGAGDLATLVFHRSPLIRANAAWSLGALAGSGTTLPADAIAALTRAVGEDPSAIVRVSAVRALAAVPARPAPATAAIRTAADADRAEPVRTAATSALAGRPATPARNEWRVFYVVDAATTDKLVREEPYVLIGADGLIWATYTDLRGMVVSEHFPAGDAALHPGSSDPTL